MFFVMDCSTSSRLVTTGRSSSAPSQLLSANNRPDAGNDGLSLTVVARAGVLRDHESALEPRAERTTSPRARPDFGIRLPPAITSCWQESRPVEPSKSSWAPRH